MQEAWSTGELARLRPLMTPEMLSYFSEELTRLDEMSFSPEKEELAKQTKAELGQLAISAIVKSQFRAKHEGIVKKIVAQQVRPTTAHR